MSTRKFQLAVALLIALSMLLASCGATPEPQVVEKVVTEQVVVKETVVVEQEVPAEAEAKEFVVGVAFDQATLDPGRGFEITGGMVHKATYNTLVTWADDNVSELVPDLAESWEVSDGGRVFTFKLRDGVKFHSGNPLTAADVKWSWDRAMGLKGNPSFL